MSTNDFNLDQFKILPFGKKLMKKPKVLDWFELKALADEKIELHVTKKNDCVVKGYSLKYNLKLKLFTVKAKQN